MRSHPERSVNEAEGARRSTRHVYASPREGTGSFNFVYTPFRMTARSSSLNRTACQLRRKGRARRVVNFAQRAAAPLAHGATRLELRGDLDDRTPLDAELHGHLAEGGLHRFEATLELDARHTIDSQTERARFGEN